MKIPKSFIILTVLAVIPMLQSQVIEITLKDAINHAYKNDPNIIKTEYSVEVQENNIRSSYGALIPDLKFSGGWSRTNQTTKGGTVFINGVNVPVGTRSETINNYNLALRSDVVLFDGLANYDRVAAAKKNKTVLLTKLQKLKQDVSIKILGDYITVLKNEQIVVINQSTLDDSRAQLESVRAFVEVGRRTLTDVYQQDVKVAQNELAVEQSKNNLNKSISDLAFDSNLPMDRNYAVNKREFVTELSFESLESYVSLNSNTEQLVSIALKNRYDYKSTIQNLDYLETNIDIARSTLLFPTLSGFGSYSMAGDRAGNIDNLKAFTVGLTLTYPIFQGFQIDNQKQLAIINYRSAEEDLKLIKNQISLDINKAILDLKSLLKQIEIKDRSLKRAEQNKLLAEESYRVGIGTLLDVNTASVNLNNLLITKTNLIYDFIYAQKQLEYYQGILTY